LEEGDDALGQAKLGYKVEWAECCAAKINEFWMVCLVGWAEMMERIGN
jgi:hypothetical protein